MRTLFIILNLVLIIPLQSTLASAVDDPVAMIISLQGNVAFENLNNRQIDFGTDIFIGDLIKTGSNSTIAITFYNGCRQEVVDQQSIIQVGRHKSIIHSGQFKQVEKLDCEIPKAILEAADSHLKAGLVIRSIDDTEPMTNFKQDTTKSHFQLKAWTNHGKQPTYKLGESIVLHLVSSSDAYILVNYYSGNGELYHLTSELTLNNDQIISGELYSIGNKNLALIAGNPAGTDFMHILASNKPILLQGKYTKAKDYYFALKQYINDHKNQLFSEQQIKLTITQ